jgi:hypothetical protein
MLVNFSNKMFANIEVKNDLIESAKSTVNYALTNCTKFNEEYKELKLKSVGRSWVRKKQWGILKTLQYQVVLKNDTIKETLFFGNVIKDTATTLVLLKNDKRFFLAGNSIIEGDIKVPFKEINELNLSGSINSFTHKGRMKKAVKQLPKIKDFYCEKKLINISESRVYEESNNDFFKKPKRIIITSKEIDNLNLSGNYILESEKEIFIKKNNKLKNIIVKSPIVKIEEGFNGVIQIYATKRVIIGKNVTLKYPSVIYASGSNKRVSIDIGRGSQVLGLVVATSSGLEENKILISKKSTIVGGLYCSGKIDFRGEMYGTIYAHEFYLNTEESEYQNALLDFKLHMLPDFFQRINIIDSNEGVCRVIKRQR